MSLSIERVYQELGDFPPNLMQNRVWQEFTSQETNPAFLLHAATGIGKTEAVLFPALHTGRRLIFVLPTRSLADDMTTLSLDDPSKPTGRFHRYLQRHSMLDQREHGLIVDTGTRMERTLYRGGKRIYPQFGMKAEKERSHLYRGDIIVTTLDKFIYRFFGFAWGRKSYVYPLRTNRPNTLVCFDEAHTYDTTAFTNFLHLVTTLYEKNVGTIVMTATLPPTYKSLFDFLRVRGTDGSFEWLDFTTNEDESSQKAVKMLRYVPDAATENQDRQDEDEATKHNHRLVQLIALTKERWKERPQRTIVATETVRGAVEIYNQLKAVNLGGMIPQQTLLLYHGRLDSSQRTYIYQQLKALDDQPGAVYILVTTAAIEVGCDLNAERLLTEICPPNALVQRAGRCNRRGNFNETAEVVVVGSHIPTFARALPEEQEQKFTALLQKHSDEILTPDTIQSFLRCLERPLLIDPRARTAFEMLYEYVYEFALENQPLYDRGFIATRGWEPIVSLVINIGNRIEAEISVEVSRLAGSITEPPEGIVVEEWRRGEDTWAWRWNPSPRSGSLYNRQIRVTIKDPEICDYTTELGFVNLPKVFAFRSRRCSYEVRLAYFLPDESQFDSEGGFFFDTDAKSTNRKEVFFRYLSDPELIMLQSTHDLEE